MSSSALIRYNADFALEIDFVSGSPDPARVFRSMTQLIDTFQRFDRELVQTIDVHIEPVMLLENVEAGSIKSWLRVLLNATDDTGLEELNWKRIVGGYLVRAKYLTIDWLNKRTEISSREELSELQEQILKAAESTGAKRIPTYQPPSQLILVRTIVDISGSIAALQKADRALYETIEGDSVEFNVQFRVVPDALNELLVEESLSHIEEMILKVKKPDFLGESKWEFVHEHVLEAKMLDFEWLVQFRKGDVILLPGSAIRASVQGDIAYGIEREVVSRSYTIRKVIEVIPPPNTEQSELLLH